MSETLSDGSVRFAITPAMRDGSAVPTAELIGRKYETDVRVCREAVEVTHELDPQAEAHRYVISLWPDEGMFSVKAIYADSWRTEDIREVRRYPKNKVVGF